MGGNPSVSVRGGRLFPPLGAPRGIKMLSHGNPSSLTPPWYTCKRTYSYQTTACSISASQHVSEQTTNKNIRRSTWRVGLASQQRWVKGLCCRDERSPHLQYYRDHMARAGPNLRRHNTWYIHVASQIIATDCQRGSQTS